MDLTAKQKLWLSLAGSNTLPAVTAQKLVDTFGSPEKLWQASFWELKQAGLPKKLAQTIANHKNQLNPEQIETQLERHHINFVTYSDPNYPALLKEIHDPPKVLFYQGHLPTDWHQSLAVVGARKMTGYGQLVVEKIIPPLAQAGLIIVSGLAIGIDSAAHRYTLRHQGKTIAVIGSGLDPRNLYPAQNQNLAQEIITTGGAIISEFPPGTPPLPHHFPLRNRIIAGLSRGTLVVEASKKSGALITAEVALNENREVMAIPGPIHAFTSAGTLKLIKAGAGLITNSDDVLNIYGLSANDHKSLTAMISDNPILETLKAGELDIDTITKRLHLTASEVSARLSQLEIDGLVKNLDGTHYAIIK